MMPTLFRVPYLNWDVAGYGIMLMIGFLLAVIWAVRRGTRSGANPDVILNIAFIALIGGVVGARFMFVVHYWENFAHLNGLNLIFGLLDVRQGGLEVYGGLIGATLGTLIYLHFWGHSLRWYLDIVAPSVALGMAIGRIGCFLNGCCWGGACDLPWAVRFPFGSNAMVQQWQDQLPGAELPPELVFERPAEAGSDKTVTQPLPREVLWMSAEEVERYGRLAELEQRYAAAKTPAEREAIQQEFLELRPGCQPGTAARIGWIDQVLQRHDLSLAELRAIARQHPSQPVHPTQLYSTITLGILAVLLSVLYWRRSRDGQVICVFLLVEPWTRYLLEILRADNPQDTFTFTISQFLALLLSLAGLIGLIGLRFATPRSPRARQWAGPPTAPREQAKPT
jgi:phosphatidylglycerol:prolipoprotein diacylglycerol transferase